MTESKESTWTESHEGQFGEIISWETEGTEVLGKYLGQHEGKYGMLIDIVSEGRLFSVSCTEILSQKFSVIKIGMIVQITFTGYLKTKTGHSLKNFKVMYKPE